MGVHGRSWDYRDTHRCEPCTRKHVDELSLAQRDALQSPNPNPSNWKIERAEQVGAQLVLELKYPDCTNFEGRKVMVYKNTTLIELVNQKRIDPHFAKASKEKAPFARFEPTETGWKAALMLASWLEQTKI